MLSALAMRKRAQAVTTCDRALAVTAGKMPLTLHFAAFLIGRHGGSKTVHAGRWVARPWASRGAGGRLEGRSFRYTAGNLTRRTHVLDGHTAWALGEAARMPPDRDNPSRWWALAAEARAVAGEMTDPQARRIMLKIAEGYERLARRAESRNKGSG